MAGKQLPSKSVQSRAVISDIALRAGVSIATVSRVLNNRPDVAPDTREKVMDIVRELGYVANRYARSLVSGQTSYIGFTVPKVEHFVQILQGATDALDEHDANLVLFPTGYKKSRSVAPLMEHLQSGGVDGALLILPSEDSSELLDLHRRGYPFVVIDPRYPLSDDIPCVAANNISGARTATEHLLALGHRHIGVITGYPSWKASIDRLAGYHSLLYSLKETHHPSLVREADFTMEGGYAAALELLQRSTPPTAIFAFNDDMAVGVIRAAHELGLNIPEELSVIGFDDATVASAVIPGLTTIRQPLYEMGRVAVDMLYRILNGSQLEVTCIELSTRLILRGSTAPCP